MSVGAPSCFFMRTAVAGATHRHTSAGSTIPPPYPTHTFLGVSGAYIGCMTDYECPSCSGGFPDGHDACPWCGEIMNGENEYRRPTLDIGPGSPYRDAPLKPELNEDDIVGPHFQTVNEMRGE